MLQAPVWGVGKDPQHKLASSWRQGHSHHSKVVPFLPGWVLSHGFPEHSGQRINCGPSIFGDSPDSGGLELHDFGVFFSDVQTFHQTFPIWRQQQDFQAPTTATGGQRFNLGPWHQPVEIYLGSASTAAEAGWISGSTDSPLSQVGLRGDINYFWGLRVLCWTLWCYSHFMKYGQRVHIAVPWIMNPVLFPALTDLKTCMWCPLKKVQKPDKA